MSSLSDIAEHASDAPVAMAARFCGYIKSDRDVAMHVARLTGIKLSLQRVALIRQGVQPDRRRSSTEGWATDDMNARRASAEAANRAFGKAMLRAAGK